MAKSGRLELEDNI